MIRLVILGAAAGGGVPQWNSNGRHCADARAGESGISPQTQTSVAVSADGVLWFLLNASPDLRAQIAATPVLHPRGAARSTPIGGVILAGGEVDAIAGLLSMRERQPFRLHARDAVLAVLAANPVFEVLDRRVVERVAVVDDRPFELRGHDGAPSGLVATLFAVPGKAPLYLERSLETGSLPSTQAAEATGGIEISDGEQSMFFIPGCAAFPEALAGRLNGAALILFDATFWEDDEMVRAGLGTRTGRDMGHMSLSGPHGTLAAFARVEARRKLLIHINNSNPLLDPDGPERACAHAHGWDVARDGMEIVL